MIPKPHEWCSYCIQGKGKPCEHHAGPNGTFVEYTGSQAYSPTAGDLATVGKKYRGFDQRIYECFGYDPRHGFWMRTVDEGEPRQTNVSERAIGRTYHLVHEQVRTSRQEHVQWAKQRAMDYLSQGDWQNAMASLASDLTKHPETRGLSSFMAIGYGSVRSTDDAKRFIEGFAD
jgi:hypothetical protein